MKPALTLSVLIGCAGLRCIEGLAPAEAAFSLTQITNTTGGIIDSPAINAAGTRIAFMSSQDLVPPGNADGNLEIFLYDTTTGGFTQITHTTGDGMGIANGFPTIDAAGTRIAFLSTRDLTPGSPGNADGNLELFLHDTTTGGFTQITNTTGGPPFANISLAPAISALGTRIAFASSHDLSPGSPGNADGNLEIFRYDIGTGSFTQITNSTGASSGFANGVPAINATGTRIVFMSSRDLTPGSPGNADGNFEIFLHDAIAGLTQITGTLGGGNFGPSINGSGTRIVFASDRDLIPGSPGNADGNFEIFLYDTTIATFTQITNTTVGGSASPAIDAAGIRIAFTSSSNLTPGSPGNPDNNLEIFLYDTTSKAFTQITSTTGGLLAGRDPGPTINAAGTRIAFGSDRDLVPGSPGNVDGNLEIFLAIDTAAVTAVPTLAQWAQIVMVALLLTGGLYALRRRSGVRL